MIHFSEYEHVKIGKSMVVHADCFDWLSALPNNTLHAIVTDPPYGVKSTMRTNWKNVPTVGGGNLADTAVL